MAKEQAPKTTVINQHFSPFFGRYEACRIILPGFYFSLLLVTWYFTFVSRFAQLELTTAGWIAAFTGIVIVSGLTMYAKETPKRRRAFTQNQPSQYLAAKARTMKDLPLLDDSGAQRLYFYILNNYVPPLFHEKIFFFGSVYFVMVQVRRTSFWFALAGLASMLVLSSMNISFPEQQGLIVFTIVVGIIYLLNIRYNKADRKMQENYRDQIMWMEMNTPLIESILRKHQTIPPLR